MPAHNNQSHIPQTAVCPVCKEQRVAHKMLSGSLLRPAIAAYIQTKYPDWKPSESICLDCLHRVRSEYVLQMLAEESGEATELHKEIAEALLQHELSTKNIETTLEQKEQLGGRIADKVANFGGSWKFIGIFSGILIVWMIVNVSILKNAFDPYPFILLNLVLSSLAALQAPVIMMSQNRQEEKDRMRGENDYRINLKAEIEIRHLHDKLDLLINHHWEKLMEVQAIQMEMMEELSKKSNKD